MMMRTTFPFIAALLLAAVSALGNNGYKFHLRLTDGRTGLLANPQFDKLKISRQQLDGAAKDRVLLFDHATGAHWVYMMLSYKPNVELGINNRGGAATADKKADIGLTPLDSNHVRVRCLRDRCNVRAGLTQATLANGQWKDFPLDSDFEIAF
jgi:hypothetical protein